MNEEVLSEDKKFDTFLKQILCANRGRCKDDQDFLGIKILSYFAPRICVRLVYKLEILVLLRTI